MAEIASDSLLKAAKEQLGLPLSTPDASVPNAYIDELKLHLLLYPHDANFRVTLEPRRGFGTVVCLEAGCDGLPIRLVGRVKLSDGGMNDGLGSLSAYRHHIAEHPTHAKNRLARVKAGIAAKRNGDIGSNTTLVANSLPIKGEQRSLVNLLDSGSKIVDGIVGTRSPMKAPKGVQSHTPMRTSSLVRVKTEPQESSALQRRLPSIAPGQDSHKNSSDASFPPSSLIVDTKSEATSKTPLFQINNNTSFPNISAATPLLVPPTSIQDTRTRITGLQTRISSYETSLQRLACKPAPSKSDNTRMAHYTAEIASLRKLKDDLNSSIPSVSIKESFDSFFSHSSQMVFGDGGWGDSAAPVPDSRGLSDDKSNILKLATHLPPYQRDQSSLQLQQSQAVASGSDVQLPPMRGICDTDLYDENPEQVSAVVLQRIEHVIPYIAPLPGASHHDENGDFHGRGRDSFVGPQAKADDIDKFLLEAGNAEQFDGNASVDKALEKLGLRTQYDLLPGMEVALMPHQTIGVAWMLEKEHGSLKGGCLGDDMGLGKTVQMIAVLVKNRSQDPMCKTNLIIAPTALLDQWKMEIEIKTNCGLKCLIYHGQTKPRRRDELLKYDVVLTTYMTMSLEWPDLEAQEKKKIKAQRQKAKDLRSDSDDGRDDHKSSKKAGLLFQIEFHRIILDEAQSIRNRRTRVSRAVTSLQAKYRWCLTGTPIINSLVDVYGYLRFLKIRPWYDFQEFQSHIGALEKKNPSLAVSRLQAVIVTFLLRRMKDSLLDGKRLIELPDKKVSLIKLRFSEEEREIYSMVEARTQATFNRFLRAGTVLKNYSQVLVLLLRLRQICSHPSLIQEGGDAFVSPEEANIPLRASGELSRACKMVSPAFVDKMKERFRAAALQRIEAEKESADAVVEDEDCPICFDDLTDAVVTPCTHIFCRDCLVDVLHMPFNPDRNDAVKFKTNERPCPTCRSPICSDKLFSRAAFMPSDADLELETEQSPTNPEMNDLTNIPNTKGKGVKRKRSARRVVHDSDDDIHSETESDDASDDGRDLNGFIVYDGDDKGQQVASRRRLHKRRAIVVDSDDEVEESPEDKEVLFGAKKDLVLNKAIKLTPRFLPSTKMKYMMDQLVELMEEHPEEKTLIVSQWTGCLQLVSDYFSENGIIHVKYQGNMNRSKRDQAVRVFMSKNQARVMLMSLKCGGVGLNLTRANNVISLDLGWSLAIEAQSFDRVHRLGQTRPVSVQRLVIEDTVEDRVLAMQERKQTLADGSLGEGSGKKIGRLSVKELAALFGLDSRGRLLGN